MDKRTRGYIEKLLDEILETNLAERGSWVLDEFLMKSREEFVLGYLLGSLTRLAQNVVYLRRRGYSIEAVKEDVVTKKDVTEIRDMLRRRISDYRRKIVRELNV